MRIRSISALVVTGAIVLSACGGSDTKITASDASTTTATTSAATTSAGAKPTVVAPTTTSQVSADETTTTEPNFTGKGSAAYCKLAKELGDSKILDNLSGSPASLKKQFEDLTAIFPEIRSKAPAEIKADIETAIKALEAFKSLFEKYGYDPTKLTTAAQQDPELFKVLDSTEFTAASDRLDAYDKKVCGIDANAESPSTTG